MQPRLPALFSRFPKADFEVRPIEKFRENAASSQYVPATPDGSRPGVFYVNAVAAPERSRAAVRVIVPARGDPRSSLPGRAHQREPGPSAMRRFALYNAYVEGWALYMRGARTPAGPLPGLPSAGREAPQRAPPRGPPGAGHGAAPRGVVPGARARVRDGAVRERIGRQRLPVAGDRPLPRRSRPGPGLQDWRARDPARCATRPSAGSAPPFDLRAFHDAVLESGPLPLDVLEKKMRAWTPAKAQSPAQ